MFRASFGRVLLHRSYSTANLLPRQLQEVDELVVRVVMDNQTDPQSSVTPKCPMEPERTRLDSVLQRQSARELNVNRKLCLAAHGYSLLLTATRSAASSSKPLQHHVLFDTGPRDEWLSHNLQLLYPTLSPSNQRKLDAIFLSHGHDDHTGGLLSAVKFAMAGSSSSSSPVPVYVHSRALRPHGVAVKASNNNPCRTRMLSSLHDPQYQQQVQAFGAQLRVNGSDLPSPTQLQGHHQQTHHNNNNTNCCHHHHHHQNGSHQQSSSHLHTAAASSSASASSTSASASASASASTAAAASSAVGPIIPPELNDMFLWSGEVPRVTDYERGFVGHVTKESDQQWHADSSIMEEQFLAVHVRGRGLVLCAGCAHYGIVNALKYLQQLCPQTRVHAIFGGLHLSGSAQELAVSRTIHDLKRLVPDAIIASGHCTGWRAQHALANAFPNTFNPGVVGSMWSFKAPY